MMISKLSKKIAIIGAGPAGLTAAETLKEKGYTNITLFEKDSTAGGKCRSMKYDGKWYELGAGIIVKSNTVMWNLAKKFNINIEKLDFSRSVLFLNKDGEPIKKSPPEHNIALLFQVLFRYRKLAQQYKHLAQPGYTNVSDDVCLPFSEWAKKHRIQHFAGEFAPFFTGWGYGYFDEIPAAYVLKYYSWETMRSFIKKSIYFFPQGIQKLWMAVAKDHEVIYDSSIQKVKRGSQVVITTQKDEHTFDELIITSPLDDALQYVDPNEDEQELFSKILTYDYRTYACKIKGFPKQDGYIPENFTKKRQGHPLFWYHRFQDSNLYTVYVIADFKMTDEQVIQNIENVVHTSGGTIENVQAVEHWKYFPHVTPEDMKNGYFKRLEALQGKNHTYYAGELPNFSSTECSASYAKKMVETHF